ncbi:glycosyltransferase [uncultured Friedmanniella sp.]|uniref:glycosyltransferase n=1 Tax=uncultured Friedmanniella sp. TaxID=335381 RepID=UPI0035CBF4C1
MKIALVAFDTRGGVQPYVALALGLQTAGHEVIMITTAGFRELVTGHGVHLTATTGDTEASVRELGGAAELGARERNRLMRRQMQETIGTTTSEVLAAADGVDLVMAGIGGSLTGRPVAEKLGVPYVEAHLQPLGPPTAAFPGPLLPQVPGWLGGPGRRLSHRVTALALQAMFGAANRGIRAELGLPRRRVRTSDSPTAVYGFSPHVVPQPPEWGPRRRITGYWSLPAAADWVPPAALVDFLAAGPPAVGVGFGSMSSRDPEALSDLVLAAVRRAGVRAVLLSGWGGLAGRSGDDVFVTAEAPHDWLFPQLAAVVHHGGAGTTGAAFSAGVPAVVVPFAVDQPFWASRVHGLGTGPTPIPRKRLTAENLGDALLAATTDAAMSRRAADLGTLIRAEDGVTAAIHHLESSLG